MGCEVAGCVVDIWGECDSILAHLGEFAQSFDVWHSYNPLCSQVGEFILDQHEAPEGLGSCLKVIQAISVDDLEQLLCHDARQLEVVFTHEGQVSIKIVLWLQQHFNQFIALDDLSGIL